MVSNERFDAQRRVELLVDNPDLGVALHGQPGGLRELTRQHGAILIFDEVITGFRHVLGGYQQICGVMPDLTTFGKGMANGIPVGGLVVAQALDEFLSRGRRDARAGQEAHPLARQSLTSSGDIEPAPSTTFGPSKPELSRESVSGQCPTWIVDQDLLDVALAQTGVHKGDRKLPGNEIVTSAPRDM